MRYAARRDANEPVIVDALERCGVIVLKISAPGLPDLLCWFKGQWLPIEVKSPKKVRKMKEQLTEQQKRLRELVTWPVVETIEEALRAFGLPVYYTDGVGLERCTECFRLKTEPHGPGCSSGPKEQRT